MVVGLFRSINDSKDEGRRTGQAEERDDRLGAYLLAILKDIVKTAVKGTIHCVCRVSSFEYIVVFVSGSSRAGMDNSEEPCLEIHALLAQLDTAQRCPT